MSDPHFCRIIGGPGTGKTYRLLGIMEKILQTDIQDPLQIGFCSFTRAARRVAAARAASMFNVTPHELEQDGWFRTMHSIAFRGLAADGDQLLTDDPKKMAMLEEELGCRLTESLDDLADADSPFGVEFTRSTAEGQALSFWSLSRSLLQTPQQCHAALYQAGYLDIDLQEAMRVIEKYEETKARHEWIDFTDLLLQFAGYEVTPTSIEYRYPKGTCPSLPVWFVDEAQDMSPLSWAVFRRLTRNSRWVYLVADPYQSLYQWNGARPDEFLNWKVDKEDVLNVSRRCPANILQLGEDCIRHNHNWRDRKIRSEQPTARIDEIGTTDKLYNVIDPREPWLVLTRTNRQAAAIAQQLTKYEIPWTTLDRGSSRAPVATEAVLALNELSLRGAITGEAWAQVMKFLPSTADGQELLVRGTKKRFEAEEEQRSLPLITLTNLAAAGGTPALKLLLKTGNWVNKLDGRLQSIQSAVQNYGADIAKTPRVRVGTIHGAKGEEAENVLLHIGMSGPVQRAYERSREGREAESCVWYVGVTRAMSRLVLRRPSPGGSEVGFETL